MKNKDRLIELLMEAETDADIEGFSNCVVCKPKADFVADYLLANDATIQKHGKWLECSNELNKYCSNCKKINGDIYHKPPFCENCGAKMDLDKGA